MVAHDRWPCLDLDQDSSGRGGEGYLDLEYIMKVEPTEFC